MLRAYLLHLGFNMWVEEDVVIPDPATRKRWRHNIAKPYLRCDHKFWRSILAELSKAGFNMVVVDLGEGVRYESHPEIAARGAWTPKKLRAELAHMRKLGLEPIPKMNFSTSHDAWLGPYSRCVSTDTYYGVCRDLIAETADLFDKPRFFHLGMDEETAGHQKHYLYAVTRQHNLWWDDLYFLINEVEKHNVRPWTFSDLLMRNTEEFLRKMPRSVLQSYFYYSSGTRPSRLKGFLLLENKKYDQAACGSNFQNDGSFEVMVRYLKNRIAPGRLKGFMQTTWKPTIPEFRAVHDGAIGITAAAKNKYC